MSNHRILKPGAAILAALGLSILALVFAQVSFATPSSVKSSVSGQAVTALQATPTATPTPIPTRMVGWANSRPSLLPGGLPQTSYWIVGGAGVGEACLNSPLVVTKGAHYWIADSYAVALDNIERAPRIDVTECGGDPDPTASYSLTTPDGTSVPLSQDSDGTINYIFPKGSAPGDYYLHVASQYGSGDVHFQAFKDDTPHIYVHDTTTGDVNPDPGHPIEVDYVNFPPDSEITVGIYTSDQANPDKMKIIDVWRVSTNEKGSGSEILGPPPPGSHDDHLIVACAQQDCEWSLKDLFNVTVNFITREISWKPSNTVQSPNQAVQAYYEALNAKQYESSWEMLSDHFKNKFFHASGTTDDFETYKRVYDNVASLTIAKLTTVSHDIDFDSKVYAEVDYTLVDGRVISDRSPRLTLKWDEQNGRWLLDDKTP